MDRLNTFIKAIIGIGLCICIANLAFPPPLKNANNTSTLLTDKNGQWLSAYSIDSGRWRLKADLSEIDPRFIAQLLAVEDKRFTRHSGVDLISVVRAMKSWKQAGHAVSGASTITMQVVRLLEPRPRTLGSKFIEIIRAVQVEMRLSKREILELYLTHTPYGGNIEGVQAAARTYFDKSARQLTPAESALLIALPQAPEARRPDRRAKTAQKSRNVILGKLRERGLINETQYKEALEVEIPTQRLSFPSKAWLTGNRLKDEILDGRPSKIMSSLNTGLQSNITQLAENYTQSLDFNVAILVVENKSMKVRAHIGSAGRDRPGGWIDMVSRPRSPGSTLKPFIYGFSFDDGISAPGSFILDIPTRFGNYQPENFNRRYHGQVRIFEALSHSLNVPAVMALDGIGAERFESALGLTGADLKKPLNLSGDTGLALALGGVGMRVEDLAILYASLANQGKARPLIWLEDEQVSEEYYQIMQASSAQKITDILRQSPTPTGRVPHWLTQNSQSIAYKTGTSYGFRDAWAAGYTDEWTVIVWTGRPDGAPRIGKTGRIAAAPLLFDIFATLPSASSGVNYKKMKQAPKGLQNFGGATKNKPEIIFPADGSEIAIGTFGNAGRGLSFAGRSEQGLTLNWYVDGKRIPKQMSSGKAIWYPDGKGFYEVKTVDENGASSRSRIRIIPLFESL